MARKYKKDIKVVLPHIDPFRDIAVYGAGEEMIKALGGVVHAGIKKPAIVPTSNNPYFKKYGDGGKKKLDTSVNPTMQPPALNFTPPKIPGSRQEAENMLTSGDLKERSNPLTKEEIKLAVDAAGIGFYPAAVLGSAMDAYDGNYAAAGLGLIPVVGKAGKHGKFWGQAYIKAVKAGVPHSIAFPAKKYAKAFTQGSSIGANVNDAYNDIFKDNVEEKAYGGYINNTDNMKKSNKKGQSPKSILSPEQRMAMQFGWGGALGSVLGAAAGSFIPVVGTGLGASIGGALGSAVEGSMDNKKQSNQQFQPQYQQPLPQQMQFAKGGMLNKRGIPHRGTSEQMPYQLQMQSYPNLEFGNGEQMLAMGGELEDTEMYAKGGIHIKPSKRGTFTAAAKKHGKSVQAFASQVLANKENYSPAMVKKANFARNAAKWKHEDGGFLNEPTEGVIERRNKNRSREPQEYATFEENFKHMYAQGGRMGAMGPMDVGNIYYADGGMLNQYNGERHENGGIPIGPNAEVEGGETSMKMGMGGEQDSTYIFSDRLQVPGKKHTFAEASKKIDSKYGRRTNDKLSDESKRLELNKLMESQEQERAGLVNSAYETIAAYGGPIRKYVDGGTRNPGDNWNNPPIDNSAAEAGRLAEEMWAVGRNPRAMRSLPQDNYKTPDKLANVPVYDFNEQPSGLNLGTGEQWATGLGYGLQGASLLARQLQLSKAKLPPITPYTMQRQVLNAEPQLREADIQAGITRRNIRDLGASTSSGSAMQGYLASQAATTRGKADILADLQNRQAMADMNVDQFNAGARERAAGYEAQRRAGQQTAQAQLFADYGNLGAGITSDYLTGQAQEGILGNMQTPDYGYQKVKGRNRYNRSYKS